MRWPNSRSATTRYRTPRKGHAPSGFVSRSARCASKALPYLDQGRDVHFPAPGNQGSYGLGGGRRPLFLCTCACLAVDIERDPVFLAITKSEYTDPTPRHLRRGSRSPRPGGSGAQCNPRRPHPHSQPLRQSHDAVNTFVDLPAETFAGVAHEASICAGRNPGPLYSGTTASSRLLLCWLDFRADCLCLSHFQSDAGQRLPFGVKWLAAVVVVGNSPGVGNGRYIKANVCIVRSLWVHLFHQWI